MLLVDNLLTFTAHQYGEQMIQLRLKSVKDEKLMKKWLCVPVV